MNIGKVTKVSFNSSQIVPSFMPIHSSMEFIFIGTDITDQSTYVLHLHWNYNFKESPSSYVGSLCIILDIYQRD